MDEFDVIDFVYDAVEAAGTGVTIYKDKSDSGVTNEHIVVNNTSFNELEFIGKTPVNVNIFIPLLENGMYRRQRMKELKRAIRKSLNYVNSDDGNCREIEILWSVPMPDLKEGFQCLNIRLDVITDLI